MARSAGSRPVGNQHSINVRRRRVDGGAAYREPVGTAVHAASPGVLEGCSRVSSDLVVRGSALLPVTVASWFGCAWDLLWCGHMRLSSTTPGIAEADRRGGARRPHPAPRT